MICRADFEQLFPVSFPAENRSDTETFNYGPSAACIARWEDDGGAISVSPASDEPHATRRAEIAIPVSDLTRAGFESVARQVGATYGAALGLIATCDQIWRSENAISTAPLTKQEMCDSPLLHDLISDHQHQRRDRKIDHHTHAI